MLKLGVNIDHIATVREARKAQFPRPLDGALLAEKAGAWGITAHLREDRRHIQDADMCELSQKVKNLNMEMAVTDEMVAFAVKIKPHSSCLVPEKRQELTTEGGLDVVGQLDKIRVAVDKLHQSGIIVSLFIDPEEAQLDAAKAVNADYVELHTGTFANASGAEQIRELERLKGAAKYAHRIGLAVNAGHGIDYVNISGILEIPHLSELNIGHSIVGRAITVGMEEAVREMINAMKPYAK
ncbi:MAG: pyridoxine 5'-phosphate synthase [Victivallales bacterium]|jgi:pyridoxine 5-phosphate synthase|nr:pyridoxine 5'-phosphate synthase [Victivallales bacterium]